MLCNCSGKTTEGEGWPCHVWLSLKTMRWAPCRYWDSSSPYFLGHFYHSSSQSPATASVFKTVISPFCAALSDRGCAVAIWTNSQNGSVPSNLLQLVIYDKQQCSISGSSSQWSDLVAFCHFLSKLLPILMVLSQVGLSENFWQHPFQYSLPGSHLY